MRLKRSYRGIPVSELKGFLEEKYLQFNNPSFIECDPVSIPHMFTSGKEREIAGFLTAAIAWGRRDLILRNSRKLISEMGGSPYEFIISAGDNDIERFSGFVHRTFNGSDCVTFMKGLKKIYTRYESMEDVIVEGMKESGSLRAGVSHLRDIFFAIPHERRAEKHFADVMSGAAGKRLFMFFRIIKVAVNQNKLSHPVSTRL